MRGLMRFNHGFLTAVLIIGALILPASIFAAEPPKKEFKPKLFGYIEGWYQSDQSDLAVSKVDNEFRVRRARIDVKGQVREEMGYRVTANLDGAAATRAQLWDGFITYKVHPLAMMTVGQFKYHFSIEGLEGTPDRVPVLRAESINDIATPLGTKGGALRDIGIQVTGGSKEALGLKYGIAVINGAGLNTRDNNNNKDIVGRITLSPVDGLMVGISGFTGKAQAEGAAFDVEESAYVLSADYVLKDLGLSLRGEYVTAEWENFNVATGAAAAGFKQEPSGWSLQAAYKLPSLPAVQLMARYEDYEKDSNTDNSHLKTTTLGATYYLSGKSRITANYLLREGDSSPIVKAQETSATGSDIGDLVLVQFLVAY